MDPIEADSEKCLGLIEVASVPTGWAVADALIKEAPVRVLVARPVTPSKFIVLFDGDVEAVRLGRERGLEVAGSRRLGDLFLPRPHPQVLEAAYAPRKVASIDAYGVLETTCVTAAIVAADAAAKEGDVELIELRLAMGLGGHAFFTLTGEVSSVECAIDRAAELATRENALHDQVILAQPDRDLVPHLLEPRAPFSDLG